MTENQIIVCADPAEAEAHARKSAQVVVQGRREAERIYKAHEENLAMSWPVFHKLRPGKRLSHGVEGGWHVLPGECNLAHTGTLFVALPEDLIEVRKMLVWGAVNRAYHAAETKHGGIYVPAHFKLAVWSRHPSTLPKWVRDVCKVVQL